MGYDAREASIELRGDTTDPIVPLADARAAELGIPSSGSSHPSGPTVAHSADLAADGRLGVRIHQSSPLADAAKAQVMSEGSHPHAKLILHLQRPAA